ncbi:Integrin-linked kinase-associated serine/threonine phosphatase 2C [Cricetulus griseus]|uniref:Integrin-linked kinase-associated serine/threonine phosphatase 2C n=1 Tax=Cricetulus griseus TaxID=10029 RepID=G3I245_CRIGR|nr:Integrin-linked kinase-associated serine/threonine phosphatase 2C [Cricetulus griseus]
MSPPLAPSRDRAGQEDEDRWEGRRDRKGNSADSRHSRSVRGRFACSIAREQRTGKEAQEGPVLFEDLPPASSTDSGSGGPLLFDDLPPAGSGDPASSVIFGLKGYVAERKGEREEMQDAHVILNDITEECRPPSSLMKPAWKDGSTATCVLAVDNILYIANLGDSRAILCRYNEESQKHAALSLSKEHNPTQYEERMRIQKAGGNVRDGRVLGVLEVSRSIGDGQYKRCGVTSVPDIRRCQLTPNDRFILLACDGLFKVFTPEEAVNFILSCLEDDKIQTREGKPAVDARYEAACNRLANKAVQRGSADNVTVMVVRIGH